MDKSKCCNALVKVAGDGMTHYYVCSRCGKSCDLQITDNEPDNRNHKGEMCPHKKILLCRESYCSGCATYQDWCLSLWR